MNSTVDMGADENSSSGRGDITSGGLKELVYRASEKATNTSSPEVHPGNKRKVRVSHYKIIVSN